MTHPHTCDRTGRPKRIVDESGDVPAIRSCPTCSVCGRPQVFPPRAEDELTDDDLKLTIQALRALAVRYRQDAQRQANPAVRERFLLDAAECERLAGRMEGVLEGMRP